MKTWLASKLVVEEADGTKRLPGSGPGIRLEQPDGSEIAIVARGDGFDCYFGRQVITNFSLTAPTAVKLGLWLVWWWVRHAWFGVKLRLWWWTLDAQIGKKRKRTA